LQSPLGQAVLLDLGLAGLHESLGSALPKSAIHSGSPSFLRALFGQHADDPYQRLLILRYLIAAGSSLLVIGLFAVGWLLGILPQDAFVRGAAIVAAFIGLFFLAFRTGWNKKVADPSLTVAQILASVLAISFVLYHADDARPIYLLIYMVAFLFGVFQLNTRALLSLACFMVLSYGIVVFMLTVSRPSAVDLPLEVLRLTVLALVLSWFALMGGYIQGLRSRLRAARDTAEATNRDLQAQKEQLDHAQHIAHLGSWDWDMVTGKLNWSREAFAIYAPGRDDIAPDYECFLQAVHPDDRAYVEDAIRQALQGLAAYDITHRLARESDQVRVVHARGKVIRDAEGQPIGMIGTVQDITEQQRIENELKSASEAAQAASRAKSQFLANMSHEIRTPVNGVLGMTELLLDSPLNELQRHYARTIHSSGAALLEIIDDILDISKIEAGRMRLEAIDVTLAELIRETMAMFTTRAEHKNLLLRCDIAPETPQRVLVDPVRLRQLLINLLGNAIKFTERGSILLEVSREPSPDDAGTDAAILRFVVHDTGIGIDLAVQQKLFQAFSQADASTTRRYGGTGLGLFVCKQLVEMMHGTIGVQSTRGRGSSFWFTIEAPVLEKSGPQPAEPVADVAAPAVPPSLPAPAAALAGGIRVLLAEDNPVNQEIALAMLRSMGCAVQLATDGAQAVEACESQAFDLIFMDCMMPLMDGLEASRRIRARETGAAHVPIVALTASAMTGDRERCLDAGMDDYLSKPFTRPQLQAMVHKWGNAAARVHAGDLPHAANAA